MEEEKTEVVLKNFIQKIIEEDIKNGKNGGAVVTRFPPEPNGYLHIGHAKSICLNFGLSKQYNGETHLRFDDTNPAKEETEYIDSIKADVKWLGFDWGEHLCYASDYFGKMYELAVFLIKAGKAYVDDLSADEIREYRGTLTEPGKESPYRNRTVEKNLDLFERMKNGEFPDGSKTLRAKIDMASGNLNFRDPVMYRIVRADHPRQGNKWCIYPMYDWAHGLEDSIEGITHSICTLEFVVHRPLYDYFIDQFADSDYRPHQYEFNRLNVTYTVMSKRKMLQLVQEGLVAGWDDPRMPTVCGLRRRGYTPEAIRAFIHTIGYTKVEGMIDYTWLENGIREDRKEKVPRVCAILDPVKLVITNYEGEGETLVAENIDGHPEMGTREVRFARELYIERGDFQENSDKNFFRLSPMGREVRLKNAYIIQATGCDKDANGNITTVYATYDPTSKSGTEGGNRKTKSTINWVECSTCIDAEARLYDRLFACENPSAEDGDFRELLNPDSLKVVTCKVEGALRSELHDTRFENGIACVNHYQFLKHGYFVVDPDTTTNHLVFNRTASLKDNWQK